MVVGESERLAAFEPVLKHLSTGAPVGSTLDLVARCVSELAGFDFCAVLLRDPGTQQLRVSGSHHLPERYEDLLDGVFGAPLDAASWATSPTAQAIDSGHIVVIEDALTDPSYGRWRHLAAEFGWRSIVSAPLIATDASTGVLNGYSIEPRRYTADELEAVATLATHATIALRLSVLVDRQHETIEQLRRANLELERHHATLEQAHEIHLALTDAVMTGAGFVEVAGRVATLIGRPVEVTDAGGVVVGRSGATPPPPPPAAAGHELVAVETIRRPIRIGPEVVGEVVAAGGQARDTDLDVRAVEHAATVLAVHVAKEREARAAEQRLQSDFVFDLLHERDDLERLARRAHHHGLALDAEHRVVVVEVRAGDERALQRALGLVRVVLAGQFPGALFSQVGERVVAVVPSGSGPKDDVAAVGHATEEVLRRIGAAGVARPVAVGVGRVANGAAGLVRSHGEARRCVDVLERIGRAEPVLAADDLGILGLFLEGERVDELRDLGEQVLGPAARVDGAGRGSLIETLEAYLDLDASVTATAARLFVHPNTVKYRLRRIEELCGLDLRRANDLLTAAVAVMSLRLLGKAGARAR